MLCFVPSQTVVALVLAAAVEDGDGDGDEEVEREKKALIDEVAVLAAVV